MDRTLNVALIGPGRMGVNYAKVVLQNPDANLVAVCGNTIETTERNAASFNVPLYYNNEWDKMLAQHPEIDTVIIATSERAHLAPFISCLKAGKNIILEKPIAVQTAEYEQMTELAFEYPDSKIFVCFTCRFDNRYYQAKQLIDSGGLGQIGYIYSRRNADQRIASRILGKFSPAYWIIVHDIDLMRWITNSEVTAVTAFESAMRTEGNFLSVRLLFENGTTGQIESTFYSKPISGQEHTRMDLECENGKIEIQLSHGGLFSYHTDNGLDTPDVNDFVENHGTFTGNTPSMINHFINVLKGKASPVVGFNDGLAAVKVSTAIERSIREKCTISMSNLNLNS
jgi:predicted dehydrogenase